MLERLIRSEGGASGVEFAMLVPLLLILLFGIIDGGRFAWEFNRAEKATQAGARVAIVTDIVASDLYTQDFVGQTVGGVGYTQGDPIQASALGQITCQQSGGAVGCTCTVNPCPALGTPSSSGWNAVVSRMQAMYPAISAANVAVEYRGSGVGYAGDPSGMDMSPLVTVRLKDLEFTPITTLLLATLKMPEAATTLTAEDSVGAVSY